MFFGNMEEEEKEEEMTLRWCLLVKEGDLWKVSFSGFLTQWLRKPEKGKEGEEEAGEMER